MVDLDDVVSFPMQLVVWILRVLWWLVCDFFVQTVGWSTGWLFFRICTFGNFPEEGLRESDRASNSDRILVELMGLVLLAVAIWIAWKWLNL